MIVVAIALQTQTKASPEVETIFFQSFTLDSGAGLRLRCGGDQAAGSGPRDRDAGSGLGTET